TRLLTQIKIAQRCYIVCSTRAFARRMMLDNAASAPSARKGFVQSGSEYVAKKTLLLGATLGCLGAPLAQAQVQIDVAKITCEQFILFKVADPRDIGLWLSGYYHGKAGTTVVEVQQLKDKSEEIKTYCRQHLQQPVMEAVDKLVKESK